MALVPPNCHITTVIEALTPSAPAPTQPPLPFANLLLSKALRQHSHLENASHQKKHTGQWNEQTNKQNPSKLSMWVC